MNKQLTRTTAVSCLQELLTELQDQDQFGKRGEAWTFAQVAAIVLVLLPPFQLVVSSDVSSIWRIGNRIAALRAMCSYHLVQQQQLVGSAMFGGAASCGEAAVVLFR
jgi:hypothetical protein